MPVLDFAITMLLISHISQRCMWVDNIKIDLKEMMYERRTEFIFNIGTGG
jgi:hypothetical protein